MPKRSNHSLLPACSADARALVATAIDAWRTSDAITLALLRAIPRKGMQAVPVGSKGRTVAEQFRHLQRVRCAWLRHNKHPGSGALSDFRSHKKGAEIPQRDLINALSHSGKIVGDYLGVRLIEGRRIAFFGGKALRWLAYMVAHEAHHRGQILLALKQNGMRLPEKIAMNAVWMKWFKA